MASNGRLIKVAALFSAATLALASCANDGGNGGGGENGGGTGEGGSGTGPITFAMGSNDADKLRPVVERWNEQNPDQEVTFHELAASADEQRDQLTQILQAQGDEYDVFALDITDTGYFAANDWLEPITGDYEIDTSGLLESAVESATYNDTLYAVPQNTNAQLLFYRTDLQPEAPTNWQELVDSCQRTEEERSGENVACLSTQLKQYEGLTVNTTQFINGWGGEVVADDGSTPALLDNEGTKEGLEAMINAFRDGVINPASNGFEETETAQSFLAGESMYAYNWPYMYDAGQKAEGEGEGDDAGTSTIKDRFAVAPIVGKDGPGASTLGGYNNAINKFSQNKGTAKAFLEFVISEETQRGFAEQSFSPVLSSIYDDQGLQDQFPYLAVLKEALENAVPRPVSPFYPDLSKAIQDNSYAALQGDKDVDQALQDMTAAIEQAG